MLAGKLSPVDRCNHKARLPEQTPDRFQLDAGRQYVRGYRRE